MHHFLKTLNNFLDFKKSQTPWTFTTKLEVLDGCGVFFTPKLKLELCEQNMLKVWAKTMQICWIYCILKFSSYAYDVFESYLKSLYFLKIAYKKIISAGNFWQQTEYVNIDPIIEQYEKKLHIYLMSGLGGFLV